MGKHVFVVIWSNVVLALLVLTACRSNTASTISVTQSAVPSLTPLPSPTIEQSETLVDSEETAVNQIPFPAASTPEIVVTRTLSFFTSTPTPIDTAIFTPTITPVPTVPAPTLLLESSIIVDHTSVALFDKIPDQYLQAAADLNMVFVDRSVGFNIHQGLNCLTHDTNTTAPNYCKRWQHVSNHPEFNVDPNEVNWNRPGGYDRSNWDFFTIPGVGDASMQINCAADTGTWSGVAECFSQWAIGELDNYQVLSFQFTYLEVDHNSSIADQPGGFFWDNDNLYDVYDLQDFIAQHPDHIFIYWTTSLARSIGSPVSELFNEQMRQYAITNGFPLFDVANILSHAPDGTPCYDNRDGIPYDNGNQSENYPDDGLNIPAICQHYTTETDGGHLGSVSAGMIRVAKAFWVLMAQIAGWQP